MVDIVWVAPNGHAAFEDSANDVFLRFIGLGAIDIRFRRFPIRELLHDFELRHAAIDIDIAMNLVAIPQHVVARSLESRAVCLLIHDAEARKPILPEETIAAELSRRGWRRELGVLVGGIDSANGILVIAPINLVGEAQIVAGYLPSEVDVVGVLRRAGHVAHDIPRGTP